MIKMTAILAGNAALAQVAAVQKEWRDALNEEGDQILRLYKQTTQTWKHRIAFHKKSGRTGDTIYVDVWTSSHPYWFVHESVSVMRGVLSPDWSPKTQPRVLSSGAGSGQLLYASKKISKPPYKAREFTEKIIEVEQKPFQKRMEHATAVGARKATQGNP